MSSEVHKQIESTLKDREALFNAEVIDFPKDKKVINSKHFEANNYNFWKLYDKSNANEDGDQLKAVVGICFMFAALIIMGLYSNLI